MMARHDPNSSDCYHSKPFTTSHMYHQTHLTMSSQSYLNLKTYLLLFLLSTLPFFLKAQVTDDFESNSVNGWTSEGDGVARLAQNCGKPGASHGVLDAATGDINYSITPSKYLGN